MIDLFVNFFIFNHFMKDSKQLRKFIAVTHRRRVLIMLLLAICILLLDLININISINKWNFVLRKFFSYWWFITSTIAKYHFDLWINVFMRHQSSHVPFFVHTKILWIIWKENTCIWHSRYHNWSITVATTQASFFL